MCMLTSQHTLFFPDQKKKKKHNHFLIEGFFFFFWMNRGVFVIRIKTFTNVMLFIKNMVGFDISSNLEVDFFNLP